MSNSLWPHGMQHARLSCSWLSLKVFSNSYPLSQWCCLTISSSATPFSFTFGLSQHQGLFQWVGSWHRGPKYWGFSFSISPSSEYSALISFRIDRFHLFAVQIVETDTQWTLLKVKVKRKVKSLSRVRLFATLWTLTYQAPPSMGFSRQEYWSGVPFPSSGDLPDPGTEPRSLAL